MVNKILFTFALIASTTAFAQCNITGNSTINKGTEEFYTVPTELAQCKDCHLWVISGGNAQFTGDHRQNTVKIKGNADGRIVLSLAILTPQGLSQCSKNIDISTSSANTALVSTEESAKKNCDVETNNLKEVKNGEGIVSFFPNAVNDSYKYNYTATYHNGETMSSTEKIPQFPFTKDNGITKISVKINSSKCIREFSKTYDANYWKFF